MHADADKRSAYSKSCIADTTVVDDTPVRVGDSGLACASEVVPAAVSTNGQRNGPPRHLAAESSKAVNAQRTATNRVITTATIATAPRHYGARRNGLQRGSYGACVSHRDRSPEAVKKMCSNAVGTQNSNELLILLCALNASCANIDVRIQLRALHNSINNNLLLCACLFEKSMIAAAAAATMTTLRRYRVYDEKLPTDHNNIIIIIVKLPCIDNALCG